MDGLPALDLWDLVVEVLHVPSNQPKARSNLLRDKHWIKNIPTKERRNSLTRQEILAGHVDDVTSNAKLSRFGALLCFFF